MEFGKEVDCEFSGAGSTCLYSFKQLNMSAISMRLSHPCHSTTTLFTHSVEAQYALLCELSIFLASSGCSREKTCTHKVLWGVKGQSSSQSRLALNKVNSK